MRRAGYFSVSVLSVLISAAKTAAATTSPQMTRAEQMTSGTLIGICLASAFAAVWIHFVLWPWADRRVNAWLLARSAATGHAQP